MPLSTEDKEQLFVEIDNEGLGYWVQNYGYKGDDDPKLKDLCEKARKAMDNLEKYLEEEDILES